jgi:hypothetical protein
MLEKSELIPVIDTVAPVGTDVADPASTEKPTEDNGNATRPVERFIVRGWKRQMELADSEYKASAGKEAFFKSLEVLTFGDWGHFDDSSLAVYAETEAIARTYVSIAFDLMVRGLVVQPFDVKQARKHGKQKKSRKEAKAERKAKKAS